MSIQDQRIALGRKTRAALLQAARRLFVEGYDKVGTPEIVRAAKVTRGALYHHFKDKRALFEAVVDDVARDLVGSINAAAETEANQPLEAILAGCRAFLASAQDKEVRQIFLVDAPAVLGWGTWRAIDARHGLGSLKEGLRTCAAQGLLHADDIPAVAHLISGALNEVAFALVELEPGDAMVASLDKQMERMVGALLSNEA